jgi:hypothetical protein
VSEGVEFRAGGVVIICMWELSFLFYPFFNYCFVCFTIILFYAVEIVITFPNLIPSRNNHES